MFLKKSTASLLFLVFFLSLFSSLLIATPAYSYNGISYHSVSFSGGSIYLNDTAYSVKLKKILEIKDSFKEKGRQDRAGLYIFGLSFYPSAKNKEKVVEIKEITFQILSIRGITEDEIQNIELILDENENGMTDIGETVVSHGKIDLANKVIKFGEPFFHQEGKSIYILKADLPNLEEGDALVLQLKGTGAIKVFDSQKNEDVSGYLYLAAKYHIEGNASPELRWLGAGSYTQDGVDPDKGQAGDTFRFLVYYRDLNGDPPKTGQVWIDLDRDGEYQAQEKFKMGIPRSTTYKTGVLCEINLPVISIGGGVLNYRFYFTDIHGKEAIGEGTQERQMQVTPFIQAYLWVEEGKDKFVDGMLFPINLGFVHYMGVNLTEDFENLDLLPFKVEKVILSPRQPTKKPNQDCQVVTLMLTLEEEKPYGTYQVPLVDIHYTCTYAAGGQRVVLESVIKTKPLPDKKHQVEKLPIIFKQSLTPETITLGDKFTRTISIFHESDRKIKAQDFLESLDAKNSFAPFEILAKEVCQKDVASIKLTEISFELTLYRLPPQDKESFKVKLSSLKIPYLDEKDEAKELLIPELILNLNTVVKDKKAPPKFFLKPEQFRIYDWKTFFKVGAGLVVLFVFLILLIFIKKLLAKRKKRKSIEPLFEAEEKVKNTLQTCKNLQERELLEQKQIAQLFIDFKVYLGHLIYQKSLQRLIEPQQAKNKTVEELVELLEKINCFSLDRELIKEILIIFNRLVYGEFNRTDLENLIEKMEGFFTPLD